MNTLLLTLALAAPAPTEREHAEARVRVALALAGGSRPGCTCGDHCPAGATKVRTLHLKGKTVVWTTCLCGCGITKRTEQRTRAAGECPCGEACPGGQGGDCPCGCQGPHQPRREVIQSGAARRRPTAQAPARSVRPRYPAPTYRVFPSPARGPAFFGGGGGRRGGC